MKKTAERETSKSMPGCSGREIHAPNPGDKRYIYRPDNGKFTQRPDGCAPKYANGYNTIHSLSQACTVKIVTDTLLPIYPPLRPSPPAAEDPDFTEADKEWIGKIDRTQLTWDEW